MKQKQVFGMGWDLMPVFQKKKKKEIFYDMISSKLTPYNDSPTQMASVSFTELRILPETATTG